MTSPNEMPDLTEVAAGIDAIRKLLGPKPVMFTEAEARGLLDVLEHREILVAFAEYQAARSLIWARWRGLVIGLAALTTAGYVLWDKIADPLLKVVR